MGECGNPTELDQALAALCPFAGCSEKIPAEKSDDEEWTEHRLKVKDFRYARALILEVCGTQDLNEAFLILKSRFGE